MISESFFEKIIIKYRWIFVIFLLLPFSSLFKIYEFFAHRLKTIKKLNKNHHNKAKDIQNQIIKWQQSGAKQMMCTARPGWQTISFREPIYKKSLWNINLSNLNDILEIDLINGHIWVEPMVKMKQITKTLNPLGWTIPVVPELDDLTVGGLLMGMGLESSSHRYGLFYHSCIAIEIILSSGDIIMCSKDKYSDLYESIPNSHGTLGFILSIKIKIIPTKPYVKVNYIPVQSKLDLSKKIKNALGKYDFVEAIVYSYEQSIIIAGQFSSLDEPCLKNSIQRFWKPWFYRHAETFLKSNKIATEYIPLQEYYHRHSKSIFWEMNDIVPFGNHPLFRYIFGWTIPPKISILKKTQGKTIKKLYEKYHFIQDILVPFSTLDKTIDFIDKELGIYPLWICPFALSNTKGFFNKKNVSDEIYIDIGIYGNVSLPDYHPENTTRRVEQFVNQISGFQMLYADCYMTEQEFREMFDHSLYDKMRTELNCRMAFPEVYEKVNRRVRI